MIVDVCSERDSSDVCIHVPFLQRQVASPLRNESPLRTGLCMNPCCDQISNRLRTVWFEVFEHTLSLSAIHKVELFQFF